MADINPTLPTVGALNSIADPQVRTALQELVSTINDLATANLADDAVTAAKLADAALLGVSEAGITRRGKSIIATEEPRTNVAYGTLTTPDQVSGLVLPTDGLIFVGYQAAWKNSVASAGRAALFLNSVQLTAQGGTGPAQPQEATGSSTAAIFGDLATASIGLAGYTGALGVNASDHVGTGTALGMFAVDNFHVPGLCVIFAAAGTYDVSVRFKSASGSVSVKNRKLWAWTVGF